MKLQDVIKQALEDPSFAGELRNAAVEAQQAGKGSSEWSTFMEYFAENEEQLANFNSLTGAGGGCTVTIVYTLNVTSTAACTLTTTTNTTTIFCDQPSSGS
jgi:hypothetical protein